MHRIAALAIFISISSVAVVDAATASGTPDPFESVDMFIEGESNLDAEPESAGNIDVIREKDTAPDPFESADMFIEGESNLDAEPESQGNIDIVDGDAGDQVIEQVKTKKKATMEADIIREEVLEAAAQGVEEAERESSSMRLYLILAAVLGAAAFWYTRDTQSSAWLQRLFQRELFSVAIPGMNQYESQAKQVLLHKKIAEDFGTDHLNYSGLSGNYGSSYGSYGCADFGIPQSDFGSKMSTPSPCTSLESCSDFGIPKRDFGVPPRDLGLAKISTPSPCTSLQGGTAKAGLAAAKTPAAQPAVSLEEDFGL